VRQNTTRIDGIDVARYQKDVDWPTVRAACATPSMAVAAWKVTQGIAYVDPYATKNRQGAASANFRWRLGYHWLSPASDPIQQADWFLAHFDPQDGEGCLLDAEENSAAGNITEEAVVRFCERVEAHTHKPVAVYTGVFVSGGKIWRSSKIFNGQRIRWVAAYVQETRMRKLCEPFGFDVWQGDGGATGRMPGVVGPVDLNMVENRIMLDVACAIQPPSPRPPDPIPIPTSSLLGATTGGTMSVVIGCSDNKADPQRWIWNGFVRHHITNEAEYANLVTAKLLSPTYTLSAPMWMTLLELAAIPLV
jgi:GH25 family lysozyme M1 (1,4-beta-N-acetylmuramidase)